MRYLYLVIAIFAYGCAPNYSNKNPDAVAAGVEVNNPEFGDHVVYSAPRILKEDSVGRRITDQLRYRLKGWVDREEGELNTQLHISIMYEATNWRAYNGASVSDDQPLKLKKLNTNVKCIKHQNYEICAREEVVGIPIPADYLTANSSKGIAVHVNSDKGFTHVINVPANYIQGYLMALNERGIRRDQMMHASVKVNEAEQPSVPVRDVAPGGKTKKQEQHSKMAVANPVTFEDGVAAMERKDYASAYKIWLVLAQRLDPRAQAYLSGLYAQGLGVEKNDRLAQRWLAGAAFGGYAPAQHLLGNAYQHGRFGETNLSQASYWWRMAALQEHPDAQYRLGMAYMNGEGVERDLDKAADWFKRAAQHGSEEAAVELQGILTAKRMQAAKAKQAQQIEKIEQAKNTSVTTWIGRQPPDAYTIQLYATTKQSAAQQFIAQSELKDELEAFSFDRGGKRYYAIINGSFDSIAAARQAINRLPAKTKKNGTWIRNFGSIHKIMLNAP
ncbi:SPOR domain-containing protein [Pseudomonadota bacterium]